MLSLRYQIGTLSDVFFVAIEDSNVEKTWVSRVGSHGDDR